MTDGRSRRGHDACTLSIVEEFEPEPTVEDLIEFIMERIRAWQEKNRGKVQDLIAEEQDEEAGS